MYGDSVRVIQAVSIRDTQNGGPGRMSGKEDERGRESSELRGGGEDAFFLWWYCFDGCLAEAPKAVSA